MQAESGRGPDPIDLIWIMPTEGDFKVLALRWPRAFFYARKGLLCLDNI